MYGVVDFSYHKDALILLVGKTDRYFSDVYIVTDV